ncbi:hypothetical protein OC846_000568 [Tilletia horrida]|uniref:Uncharacterized protein n=1 Tax=Tilletia horrida TaxID=155126 RepID=A0AAN6GY14_9BASI|nr:hypothetical protein OC846_000568 [Tilletia horrida]
MLNFKLGWPSALRSSTSSASLSASASASSDQSPASPSSSSTLARSNSTASLKKKTPAPGIPASVRYFAIFDPRPPPSPPQDKGKGKQRAVEDDNVEQQEAGGAGEEPPSTTVLFYSSPSEPTTTQTTIQRRLGLASAIVQFTTDLSSDLAALECDRFQNKDTHFACPAGALSACGHRTASSSKVGYTEEQGQVWRNGAIER